MVMTFKTSTIFASMVISASAADSFLQKAEGGSLLADLTLVFGPDSLEGRVDRLEGRVKTMFASLPKSSGQFIAHSTARYALNRAMNGMYGWSLPGLETGHAHFNTTDLIGSGILNGLMPDHIQQIFARNIQPQGFQLRDLAILGGTMEHLVHENQKEMLLDACQFLDLPTVGQLGEKALMTIIELYQLAFLATTGTSKITMREAFRRLPNHHSTYPGWPEVLLLLTDERENLAFNERSTSNPFQERGSSFEVAQRVVERIAGRFARSHVLQECMEMSEDLLTYERGDSGRVGLADFYRASLDARFYFVETKDYLRAMGALDESDPLAGDKVIVVNYIQGRSNCLSRGNTYSVCCVSECEELYDKVEDFVAGPHARPKDVAALVASLSTSTVQAPRNLSETLVGRLEDMAAHHAGDVPLHGRLFAQWMHQAFPRECAYPFRAGTVTTLNPAQWSEKEGRSFRIDDSWSHANMENLTLELVAQLEASLNPDGDDALLSNDADLAWTLDEELLVEPSRPICQRLMVSLFYFGMLLAVAAFVTFATRAKVMQGSDGKTCDKAQNKFFV